MAWLAVHFGEATLKIDKTQVSSDKYDKERRLGCGI
jgi:hypothetical protein